MRNRFVILVAFGLLVSGAWAQQSQNAAQTGQQSTPGMDMSGMKNMPAAAAKDADSASDNDSEASMHAMHSMEGHMDMGPHMKMTALRPSKPGDADRAQQIVESARKASEKYTDYRTALADGYKIFHAEIPQKIYHFTNYGYAMEAAFRFNPEHPTSLLFEKHGDDYKLIGVMYLSLIHI